MLLSIEETVVKLGISEFDIIEYLGNGILIGEIHNNKQYITLKSINQFEENKPKTMTRKKFFSTLGRGAASTVGGGLITLILWEGIRPYFESKELQTDIKDLFSFWDDIRLFPGHAHPKWNGFHPDVVEAQNKIAGLFTFPDEIEYRKFENLPELKNHGDLLLIGGPISNSLSRSIHGYNFKGEKISHKPIINIGTRWSFYYPESTGKEKKFSRYVNKKMVTTKPKAIIDMVGALNTPRYSQINSESEFIKSDYLLITVLPNNFSIDSSGSTIVDVADLHGQGNKAFAKIMENQKRRNELFKAVNGKRYFQALYEIGINHDDYNKETSLGEIVLDDVHILS